MGLDDEKEKLRSAEAVLADKASTPARREAAREHVEWVYATSPPLTKIWAEANRIRQEYLVAM